MTNVNAPFGLRPVRRIDGAGPTWQAEPKRIAYNYGTAIAHGDPIILLNTGYIARYANGGSRIDGVFWGCKYLDPNLDRVVWSQNWPAITLGSSSQFAEAYVIMGKDTVFEIQAGSGGAPFADIGTNSDIVIGTASSAGISGAYLDSTHDTTATFPLRIVQLGQGVVSTNQAGQTNGYDPLTGYNIVQVIMNTYGLYNTTGL